MSITHRHKSSRFVKHYMWGHKKGLGLQLTYGVPGNGVLVPSTSEAPDFSIEFAQLHRPKLHCLTNDTKCLRPKQTDIYDGHNLDLSDKYKKEYKYIHRRKLVKENTRLCRKSLDVYDPTFGTLINFFYIRSGVKLTRTDMAVAFASGQNGNILEVAEVRQAGDVTDPKFVESVKVHLNEPIRQIITHKRPYRPGDFLVDYLLVRSGIKVYVFNCTKVLQGVDLKFICEIGQNNMDGYGLADICFGPPGSHYVLVVDIKGGLFRITFLGTMDFRCDKIDVIDQKVIAGNYELSNWRRVWSIDQGIFIASRSSLVKIHMKQKTIDKIISAETWSTIRDVQLPVPDTMYLFILTSQELIWVDISGVPKRLISWKHYLSESDPTLKLAVHKDGDTFICLIYCQTSPMILCYTFGMIDNKPYHLTLPSAIPIFGGNVPIQTICIHRLNASFYQKPRRMPSVSETAAEKVYVIFDMRLDLSINSTLVAATESMPASYSREKELVYDNIQKISLRNYNANFFGKFSKVEFLALAKELTKTPKIDNDLFAVQKYAFELGSHKDFSKYLSLADISRDVPIVTNIDELDSMIEQLTDHFREKNITLINCVDVITKFKVLNGTTTNPTTIQDFFQVFQQYADHKAIKKQTRSSSFRQFIILLATSLLRVKQDGPPQPVADSLNGACSSTRAILDDWDTNYEEPMVINRVSQPQLQAPEVPTINLSQSQPALSQSLQFKPFSQSQSQRKRKKTRGFA